MIILFSLMAILIAFVVSMGLRDAHRYEKSLERACIHCGGKTERINKLSHLYGWTFMSSTSDGCLNPVCHKFRVVKEEHVRKFSFFDMVWRRLVYSKQFEGDVPWGKEVLEYREGSCAGAFWFHLRKFELRSQRREQTLPDPRAAEMKLAEDH